MKDMLFVFALAVLLLTARILIPKMLETEHAGHKFGYGLVLFGIYTAVMLFMFRFFCGFDGDQIRTGEDVYTRMLVAFLTTNLLSAFSACLYFFTREKRKLTQAEKMKLKDM